MKKTTTITVTAAIFCFCNSFLMSQTCDNQYCIPLESNPQNWIRRVRLNTLDHSLPNATSNCPSIIGYSDYTNMSTSLTRGQTYSFNVTATGFADTRLCFFFDWNNDKILSQAERYQTASNYIDGNWVTSFTVPTDATLGATRLRIRIQNYFPSNYAITSCGVPPSPEAGQTVDYSISVVNVIPVTLINFAGKNTDNGNMLSWQTATEINSSHFDVERSLDGHNFGAIDQIKTNNKSSAYSFLDKNAMSNLIYYRLKMVDLNGSAEYSKIVSITKSNLKNEYKVFPNPIKNQFNIQFTHSIDGEIQISFLNNLGQKVYTSKHKTSVSINNINLDFSQLPNGIYYGEIFETDNSKQIIKIVKN
jgi:hypothetical protein